MLTITLASLALVAAPPHAQDDAATAKCSSDMGAMLVLDRGAFDQDMTGGWRSLASRGCEAEAAELIRAWRHEKRDNTSTLYWHEAQMRAFAGETAEAIELMHLTYKPPEFDEDFGWNYYVSGSIAFLTRDREPSAR